MLGRWLPLLTCLSGAAVPATEVIGEEFAPRAVGVPDLEDQMRDLLEFVDLQEKRWRPQRADLL